jgi:nuclease-like protein
VARTFPRALLPDDVKSDGEVKVFHALRDGLDDAWDVFHSVGWVRRDPGKGAEDGEIDFVLAHPREGVVCIEAKGGDIECRELGTNCRTTQAIHRHLLRLYDGETVPDSRGPEGREPELHHATDQAETVDALLDRLLGPDDVSPDHVPQPLPHRGAAGRMSRQVVGPAPT